MTELSYKRTFKNNESIHRASYRIITENMHIYNSFIKTCSLGTHELDSKYIYIIVSRRGVRAPIYSENTGLNAS